MQRLLRLGASCPPRFQSLPHPLSLCQANGPLLRRSIASRRREATQQYPPKIQHLLRLILPLVKAEQYADAFARFHDAIGSDAFHSPTRFLAYESAIGLFLRHDRVLAASMLYSRMLSDGFIPSGSLRAQMHLITVAKQQPSEEELFGDLLTHFKHSSFDETALRDILRLMVRSMNASPDFLDKVVALYLETRADTGYTLARETHGQLAAFHKRTGSLERAHQWAHGDLSFLPPGQNDHAPGVAIAGSPLPATSLLRTSVVTELSPAAYERAMQDISANTVLPDRASCNALILFAVRHNRLEDAFRVYCILRDSEDPRLYADAFAFTFLFRALRRALSPRSALGRGGQRPRSIIAPYELYAQMLQQHSTQTGRKLARPSSVITLDALHSALKLFLVHNDYSAAFVVLRTFKMCGLSPSLRTWRILFASLVHKIQRELKNDVPSDGVFPWSLRFLGTPIPAESLKTLKPFGILKILLHMGHERRLSLQSFYHDMDQGSAGADFLEAIGQRSVHVPTSADIAGLSQPPAWDILPLERILRRAILAQLLPVDPPFAAAVSGAIAETKARMIHAPLGHSQSSREA